MLASWKFTLTPTNSIVKFRHNRDTGFCCKAETPKVHNNGDNEKKVLIVGSGWAGLGAAHHLCNQGFNVTVLEDGNGFGSPDNVGIQGFWYPYRNIFSLVDKLGIKPFTNWMQSAQYSPAGLEVKFPVFQDLPQLPTPLGTLYHSQFMRLPLVDRLTSLPLMAAVIDFDNTDVAWRKYDPITARELFKQYGCSDRLYRDIFWPLVQVGLFAPPQLCSAAATLGIMYYISLAHQRDFDMVLCRGAVKEKIFDPWMDSMRAKGCQFLNSKKVTDFFIDEETGHVTKVFCGNEMYGADAVILAVGIHTLQELVKNSAALRAKEEFLKVLNLNSIDMLCAKIQLDKKVKIPTAVNACSSFDNSFGWTLFELNALYDEYKESPVTVLQADFCHANELLPLKDEDVVKKVINFLSIYIDDIDGASVIDKEITRFPSSLTHFFPGSYKYMLRGSTSFPNLFMAGDWIVNRHGSWSQEKSYVTGLEAANRVIDLLGEGSFARIIPVEEDEAHVDVLRGINRRFNEIREQLPLFDFFLQ